MAPKQKGPVLTLRQWEVVADALDSHASQLEAHDEEWLEDLKEARALEVVIRAHIKDLKKST